MLIAIAYCLRDYKETKLLLDWIEELGGCREHELLILHDARVPNQNMVDITALAGKIFKKVTPIVGAAAIDGWPQGANYMWRTVTNVLSYRQDVRFFLWLEPDAIPLREGWAEALEKEFIEAAGRGARFMGDRVEVQVEGKEVPLHMSGVGIYPNPLHQFSGEAYRAHELAWDMAGKDQIVPLAHFTKLIEHAWKHPSFTNVSELYTQIRPEAVLFHASKDGSLIKVLRQQRTAPQLPVGGRWYDPENLKPGVFPTGMGEVTPRIHCLICGRPPHPDSEGHSFHPDKHFPVSQPSQPAEVVSTGAPLSGSGGEKLRFETVPDDRAPRWDPIAGRYFERVRPSKENPLGEKDIPVTDIFIRTYPGDYKWLDYCLRSIGKYAIGFRKVWIISPQDNPFSGMLNGPFMEWKQMNDETEDGYLAQQITKLYADVITDYQAEFILHIDSDTLLTRPVTPSEFFYLDKVLWPYTPYDRIQTPWQPVIEKFMAQPTANEFMRRFPIMVPRWLYPRLREFCYQKHGMTITDYVRGQPLRHFSEFNALGAYAWQYHHDKIAWVDTLGSEFPLMPPMARQFFSWGGITEEVKAEIENILGDRVTNASKTTEKISPPTRPFCIDDIKADLHGTESEPAVLTQPNLPVPHPTSVPVHAPLTPFGQVVAAIEMLKSYAGQSTRNRIQVVSRLSHAGLKPRPSKKKKK